MTNPSHYSNIDLEPHEGDRVRLIIAPGRLGEVVPVDGTAMVRVYNGWPSQFELVQPWWDATTKPGAQWKDRGGSVWTKRDNGMWARGRCGVRTALHLERSYGPGELVTPEPAPIPDQPTGLTEEQRNLIIRLSELFTQSIEDEVRAAFPEVFDAEPGADIPDEVVAAAMGVLYDEGDGELPTNEVLRAALAAADAKRAELEGQA